MMNIFNKPTENSNADLQLFIIFDTKVGNYRLPMFSTNKFSMLREIEQLMLDPQHKNNQYVTNSEDFQLFKMGDFWYKNGKLIVHEHEHIANMHDLRAAAQQRAL